MVTTLEAHRARAGDAARLAACLRPADRAELQALGRAPREALNDAVAASLEPMALSCGDGRLIALYGVVPYPDADRLARIGAPWMMATPMLAAVRAPFLRGCRAELTRLEQGFDLLANRVDARNALHRRWLRWLGFSFVRRLEAFGPERRPFLEFVKTPGLEPGAMGGRLCATLS